MVCIDGAVPRAGKHKTPPTSTVRLVMMTSRSTCHRPPVFHTATEQVFRQRLQRLSRLSGRYRWLVTVQNRDRNCILRNHYARRDGVRRNVGGAGFDIGCVGQSRYAGRRPVGRIMPVAAVATCRPVFAVRPLDLRSGSPIGCYLILQRPLPDQPCPNTGMLIFADVRGVFQPQGCGAGVNIDLIEFPAEAGGAGTLRIGRGSRRNRVGALVASGEPALLAIEYARHRHVKRILDASFHLRVAVCRKVHSTCKRTNETGAPNGHGGLVSIIVHLRSVEKPTEKRWGAIQLG